MRARSHTPFRLVLALLAAPVVAPAPVILPAAAASPTATTTTARAGLPALLSAPFPTALTASADGDAVAWVFDERGARNVWVAEAPAFRARRVTAYTRDDGQVITDLHFAGDWLVFVRGGAPNRRGELPNPLGLVAGVERRILAARWRSPGTRATAAEPVVVAQGEAPVVSPDGDTLLFRRSGRLYALDLRALGTDEPPEPRLVVAARGNVAGVRFRPDGERILFVSNRGTHALVGVVPTRPQPGDTITWLDPSVDSDTSAVWSPDGLHVAFVRVPARRPRTPFGPRRAAQPWSIRIADPATGTSRVVFTAAEGPGSVLQRLAVPAAPTAAGALVWTTDDRLVFPWETTGWKGLYSVPASGGEPVALAPGEFEVEAAALARDGRSLWLVSNQDDIERRHLWRVPADGSAAPRRLTDGRWIEWSPVPLAGGRLAYLRSDATTPAHPVIAGLPAGPRPLAPEAIPADFPADALVIPAPVAFRAADGLGVRGQLFLPAGVRAGERRPAVVFFHGGSRRQMLLGFHYLGYYHNAYAFNQYLASRGYVVLSVNYRSGIGYGLEFREALGYGASGGSEFNDVLGAGIFLRSLPQVDPARIGLWGGSYGGYLTAMGLARASGLFAAGVDLHGVHDWNEGIRIFVPDYDPDEETARLAFASSPNASLDSWRSPVLLIHGDDDRNVFFSQTVDLVRELRARDVHVEQLVFPDEVHGFLLHRSWLRAYEAAADFFDRMLAR